MRYSLLVFATATLLTWSATSGEEKPSLIAVGQPIAKAIEHLRERDIEWHEGDGTPRQVIYHPSQDTTRYVIFTLEKGINVHITYPKDGQKISSISFSVYPLGNAGKLTESLLFVESLQVEADGSYHIHILPRTKKPKSPPTIKFKFRELTE